MSFYVIMPLGSDPDASDKRSRIEKIAHEQQLTVHFPKYSPSRATFELEELTEELKGADFIIVDLSLERPSCYYELGLAEALRKPVYLIARLGTNIHQTSNRDKVSFFVDLTEFEALVRTILFPAVQRALEANKPIVPPACVSG